MSNQPLSKTGARMLAEAEAAIERGLATFVEVGAALFAIRDGRLYREAHDTFEAYCLDRWGFTSRRARQLIDAAEMGTTVPLLNEAQARELAPLRDDTDAMRAAWDDAASQGPVTAASLALAVQKITRTTTAIETTATEVTETTFDPETGEVLPNGNSEIVEDAGDDEPPASSTQTEPGEAPEGTAQADGDGQAQPHPAPTSVTSPGSPPSEDRSDIGYRSTASRVHAQTRSALLTLDPERIAQVMDTGEWAAWRAFASDLIGWAGDLVTALDDGKHLRRVK